MVVNNTNLQKLHILVNNIQYFNNLKNILYIMCCAKACSVAVICYNR